MKVQGKDEKFARIIPPAKEIRKGINGRSVKKAGARNRVRMAEPVWVGASIFYQKGGESAASGMRFLPEGIDKNDNAIHQGPPLVAPGVTG